MERNRNVYSLNQLMKLPLPKPESIINGLLFADETVLCIARQKEGKSTLMLQLCLDVAAGADFLGRYPCAKKSVMYVDYENRPYRIQERAKDILGNAEAPPEVYFYALNHLSDRDVGLRKDEEYKQLEALVIDKKPGLLVIDPLRYAVGGELDEVTSMSIIESVAQLKQKSPNMAVILVHHTRKSSGDGSPAKLKADPRSWVDRIYGSQALLAHVEAIWGLERDDDLYTFATVPRSQPGLNLRLGKDHSSERFVFDSETKQELTEAEKAAWSRLPNSFTWTQAESFGIASSTLSRTLGKAVRVGLLFQDRETKAYRKLSDSVEQRNSSEEMRGPSGTTE